MVSLHRFVSTSRLARFATIAMVFLIAQELHAQTTLHVDDDAPPGGNGSTWSSAMNDLQAALTAAAAPGSTVTLIKVAQGRYVPSLRTDPNEPRSVTFQLRNNLTLSGGYAGLGARNPDIRDTDAFISLLSGDIHGDDQPDFVNNAENAHHVLVGNGIDASAVLDGFEVREGNANVLIQPKWYEGASGGGALRLEQGNPVLRACTFSHNWAILGGAIFNFDQSSPTISQCTFIRNRASTASAIYNVALSSPVVTNCTFVANHNTWSGTIGFNTSTPTGLFGSCFVQTCLFDANTTEGSGGAINANIATSSQISNCTFLNNSAGAGGGAINTNSPASISHCVFRRNSAHYAGGALSLGGNALIQNCEFTNNRSDVFGGVLSTTLSGSVTLVNCVLDHNVAQRGGAAFVSGNLVIINSAVTSNEGSGFQISNNGAGDLHIKNSIVWGNSPAQIAQDSGLPPDAPLPAAISYSAVQNGPTNNGNINTDPRLVQPGCGTVRLGSDSPCLNAGSNAVVPPGITTDIAGNPRISNAVVDMGPYEGGHDMLPPVACADDIDQYETVRLVPSGNGWSPIYNPVLSVTNNEGPENASMTALESSAIMHANSGGYIELGKNLVIDTTIPNGLYFMRIYLPFDETQLGDFGHFDVNVTYFNAATNQWILAVAGNIQNSPNHEGPVGDRILVEGTGVQYGVNAQVGDHGAFWNPQLKRGFAWANVDHASDFAFGVPLPPCPADCAFPSNGNVGLEDLIAVIDAWGIASQASFTDITRNGKVDVDDLLAVINAWGPCR